MLKKTHLEKVECYDGKGSLRVFGPLTMIQIFRDIAELLTLKGVAKKDGRRVLEKDLGLIKRAAFIEEGGRLIWVGRESQLTSLLIKELCAGKEVCEYKMDSVTVIPSFTESHTHLVFAGDRSNEFEMRHLGMSYQQIAEQGGGILSTVRATRKATASQLFDLVKCRVDEFVNQGVTCLEIKSGYALDRNGEMKMLKVAGGDYGVDIHRTFMGAHACPPEYKSEESYVQFLIEEMLPEVAARGLATRVDIFIEKGYFSRKMASAYFKRAKGLGFQVTAHVEQLKRTGGAVLAARFGALSVDHLVQASRSDIAALSASNTVCTLLPGADLYLKMPYPPARAFIEAGACVALATDFNPGSCPTQNLSVIGLLARLEMKMSLAECLSAYTYGAAKALGVHRDRGSFVKGKLCDFICLDGSWRDLFYSIGRHPVSQVWCRGERLR